MNESLPPGATRSAAFESPLPGGDLSEAQTLPSERWLIDQSCRQVVLLWYGRSPGYEPASSLHHPQ